MFDDRLHHSSEHESLQYNVLMDDDVSDEDERFPLHDIIQPSTSGDYLASGLLF